MNKLASNIRIVPKEHFWVSGIKRGFELSGLIPLASYVEENFCYIPQNKDLEFSIGSSTIVYQLINNEIQLITGWRGSRKKIK